jgi:hypothetical protein
MNTVYKAVFMRAWTGPLAALEQLCTVRIP